MLSQTYPCLEVETVSNFIPLCYNILLLLGRGCYRGGGGEGERRGIINRLERDVEGWGGTKIDALRILFLGSRGLLNMDFNLR